MRSIEHFAGPVPVQSAHRARLRRQHGESAQGRPFLGSRGPMCGWLVPDGVLRHRGRVSRGSTFVQSGGRVPTSRRIAGRSRARRRSACRRSLAEPLPAVRAAAGFQFQSRRGTSVPGFRAPQAAPSDPKHPGDGIDAGIGLLEALPGSEQRHEEEAIPWDRLVLCAPFRENRFSRPDTIAIIRRPILRALCWSMIPSQQRNADLAI